MIEFFTNSIRGIGYFGVSHFYDINISSVLNTTIDDSIDLGSRNTNCSILLHLLDASVARSKFLRVFPMNTYWGRITLNCWLHILVTDYANFQAL